MITAKDFLRKLTDVFTKRPNSNLGKLFTILADQIRQLEETHDRIRAWRDIDQAEGTTLDKIGTIVNQPRGVATDEVYRILLKSKIARNLSTGDINTIIRILSLALSTDPSNIEIKETWNDPVDPEPAGISVIKLPIEAINQAGLPPGQFVRMVQKTVVAGVRVREIELTGTFEFASGSETEIDVNRGFSNLEGTSGGTLGYAYTPSDDTDLPI
ncbi:hypothetical protein BRE01_30830 [Brevibacillus reuszeri]|uniref:DUF2612 domain-containing protein n=1 Tax=Brevibacillus reuszeri TaxID=54915 RepID=A0A0K9YYR0_9BACL|nr:DUF2612 domain-containing protein [Brevibacillus reuszeri]KNB73777.1 hypothetical protein ADS79_07525 [Brevibacillus reuszeri]MED1858405.1 DUF2612 domain-containing protein [Brevibacillus reuszeri]GED69381.1 hypothetical protein BRE01_30830 [Brevibacillus reuszeri]